MRKFSLCYFIILLFFVLNCAILHSQTIQPDRSKTISFTSDTITIDSLSLQGGSIKFITQDSQVIDVNKFYIDYVNARILLLDQTYRFKPVKIQYMVFPFNLSKTYSHKERKENGFVLSNQAPYVYKPLPEQNDVFGYNTLNRSGTFTRGISFGNSQDLVVNSFVDIQLSGKIAPDIEVLASLNDRNIPVQPEGTTATLQTFDQKFISVTLPHQKVMLGDLSLISRPESYFLKYNKKVQGITSQSSWNATPGDSGFTSVTASITKGKYQRQVFNGTEGNQGPYRLQGADGELYVIVVAGTEKVYIDGGEQLKRGEQNDYKIDYNTGELTFTPNHLITQYTRITVEFQYADRNYQRYLLHGFTEYKIDKWDFYLNAYHEQDNAQQPILATLTPDDKQLLSKVGDSVQFAVTKSGDSVAFNADMILYKKKDTSGYKGIYFFSTNSDSAHWQVSFSYVGAGHGNYKEIKALANGKVYGWFPPKNGALQGDYEPVTKIVAPQKQQMVTFGAIHKFGTKGKFGMEAAVSSHDANTLSSIDDGDNVGAAARIYADNEFSVNKDGPLKIQYHAEFEHRDKDYTEVERTRNVEFTRIWIPQLTNSAGFTDNADDNLGSLTAKLFTKSSFNLSNATSFYKRGNYFNGLMENPTLKLELGKYVLNSSAALTFINNIQKPDSMHDQRAEKYFTDFSRSFKLFRVGVGATEEESRYFVNGTQFITTGNFKYDEEKVYLSNPDKSKTVYGLELNERRDYSAYHNNFTNSNTGRNLLAKLYLLANPEKQLKIDFKYRNNVADTAIGTNAPKKKESTYLTHVEYLLNLFHEALNMSSIYEISTGQELRQDYIYVQVAIGQGTHVWIDYNHNGLKEFNEFELAPFKDLGEYVRVIVPSSEYQTTVTNQYQQNIKLQPGKFFTAKTVTAKLFSRFTDNVSISILNKLHTDPTLATLNPFNTRIGDSQLVTTTSQIRNVFYFNRTSPVWGADYTYSNNISKTFLVSGFDSRNNFDNTINMRWNLNTFFTLEPLYTFATHYFASDYFSSKDFVIHYFKQGGILAWQVTQKLRFNLNYYYTDQHNTLTDPFEKEYQQDGGLEARYNWLSKAIISARVDYISIKYDYDPSTPIAYEMLAGLRPGDNFTWTASWNQRLQNSLQLTFSYEGRKSEGSKAVNIGRANVTWFF